MWLKLAQLLLCHAVDSVISSTEPKACETGKLLAHTLGKPFHRVEGLHEHDRGHVGHFQDGEDFGSAVRYLFERPMEPVFGRETADEAQRRFSDALDGVLRAFEGENLAVVAHGTVISIYVASNAGVEPYVLWKRLGSPSYVVMTLPQLQLVKIVESGGEIS